MLIFSTERAASSTLNESPSEKEGKYRGAFGRITLNTPSMKVPPKRKGNDPPVLFCSVPSFPQ